MTRFAELAGAGFPDLTRIFDRYVDVLGVGYSYLPPGEERIVGGSVRVFRSDRVDKEVKERGAKYLRRVLRELARVLLPVYYLGLQGFLLAHGTRPPAKRCAPAVPGSARGGRSAVFTIKKPESILDCERLVVTVDGRELTSIRVDRAPDEANPRQACFVEGLFGWCVSKSARSGSVCVECRSATLNNPHAECTAVVFERKTEPVTEKYDRGSYALVCAFAVENTYKWTWRVRIGYLGLAEAQAPARSLESSERTP